jgi:hypothetical protein
MQLTLDGQIDAVLREAGLACPPELSGRRAALEAAAADPALAARVDPLLLALREREVAAAGLPARLGGASRGRLLASDAISTVWEAWDSGGQRVALRVLAPAWRHDPVWLRRLERGALAAAGVAGVARAEWISGGETPHVRYALGGPALADLLPAEDPPSERELARFLAGGLRGLAALHARGLVAGALGPESLLLGPEGVTLAWFDPVLRSPGDSRADLSALGRAVGLLDPGAITRMGGLAHGFAESPPPTASDGAELLRRTMAGLLADARHTLVLRARVQRRATARGRLLAAVRRLERALPPPAGTVCLRAGHDAVMVVAESDGEVVRGGPVAGVPARFLPVIYTRAAGLDPGGCRALLRAWATRTGGDEERRARIQAQLGADDAAAAALCRWLAGQARLRASRLLLERSR